MAEYKVIDNFLSTYQFNKILFELNPVANYQKGKGLYWSYCKAVGSEENILGNNITEERVIRDMLEVDEGDPFNKLLHAKSINNLKARGIFQDVKTKIVDTTDGNLKNIDITVEEKATGEILVGAGVGSEGGTAQFSVSENNFLGKGVKLSTGLRISETRLRGNFTITNPNLHYMQSIKVNKGFNL